MASSVAASTTASAPCRSARWTGSTTGIGGLPGHRTGSKIALDLETLAVQHLPFVVRDLDRREQVVDRGQVDGGRIVERRLAVGRRAARQPGEPVLDPLGLGADRQMRGRRRQPAGHRGPRAHDVAGGARDEQVHRVDEHVQVRAMELDHVVGHQGGRLATGHPGEPLRRTRHHRRSGPRRHVEAGLAQRVIEIARDVLVVTRFDDERHVRVRPAPGQAPRLAVDGQTGQEDEHAASSAVTG